MFLVCLFAASALGADLPDDPQAAAMLADISDSSSLERNLRVLCDEIGGRLPGTPSMDRAVDWAVEAFRQAGADEVHTEAFTIPHAWREGRTRIEVVSPIRFAVRGASSGWAPATRGGLRAQVLDAGSGAPGFIRRLGTSARGKILLLRSDVAVSFQDLANEQGDTVVALREAVEVGAAALLFISNRPRGLLYRHVNTVDGRLDPIPTALVGREDGLRILRLLEQGRKVEMRVSLPNQTGGPIRAENVVAEIRGSEIPQEVVILGAHLDSWDLGTGCLDNAANVSLVIEAARGIAASPRKPRRTVRFVLFSGEEQGLLGSQAYIRGHRSELDSIAAVIVHDMGVGKIKGYSLGGRRDIRPALAEAMAPLEAWGATSHSDDAFFGSDHFDFLIEGIPALIAMQDTTAYALSYHSSADTFDKVNQQDLSDAAGIAAVTVFGVADLRDRLGERLSRTEIEDLMERTDLDRQLRFLGLWNEWEEGRRGRPDN